MVERDVLDEILEERAVSNRGRAKPLGVKRKMSNYPIRARGPLSRKSANGSPKSRGLAIKATVFRLEAHSPPFDTALAVRNGNLVGGRKQFDGCAMCGRLPLEGARPGPGAQTGGATSTDRPILPDSKAAVTTAQISRAPKTSRMGSALPSSTWAKFSASR